MWNFGDGYHRGGRERAAPFEYPGRYALVLNIAQDKLSAMDEAIITAEPAKLAFLALPDAGVEIDNLAGRDLDLSGWLVRAGAGLFPALFTLPPHSIILSGSSMHISRATLGFAATLEAELQYPNGVEALQAGQTTPGAVQPASSGNSAPAVTVSAARVSAAAAVSSGDGARADDPSADSPDVSSSTDQAAAAGSASPSGSKMWWVAAAGLAAAAGGSLVAARRFGKKEWDIIEE